MRNLRCKSKEELHSYKYKGTLYYKYRGHNSESIIQNQIAKIPRELSGFHFRNLDHNQGTNIPASDVLAKEANKDLISFVHGVFQLLSGWADEPEFEIRPGNSYKYRFNLTGQEGTRWWHAHVSWLQATVHGALIIRPKRGRSYPFPKPYREVPILLGEWWNANVVDVENEGLATGAKPNNSDAYTINGQPGDLYRCSSNSKKYLHTPQISHFT
ncbi:hypothetical protein RND71_026297 [Anisodus tanguticus]|uniref:Plastocyanin-like domain-containing protein n=1 Tax=Anisodus tanguticus TaxID=243964 RepID=A0AAE1RLZ6_9SOLA|nr:hypothetical protein RND71_026297 [Anisodus tanguticus]